MTLPLLQIVENAPSQLRGSIRPNLKGLSRTELRERFRAQGLSAFRADQVFAWLHRGGARDVAAMTDLPRKVRGQLEGGWSCEGLEVVETSQSVDGTRKLLLAAADGAVIEAVLIPEARRNTLCVSTQVGCALACSFCASGAMGFTRNLSVAEIVDQVLLARAQLGPDETLSNVVFMGMGEPLLNLPAVAESIRILTDHATHRIAPRRITVSTSGVVPKIRSLLELGPINLAISLHGTTDAVRDVLVPLNRSFPLAVLLSTLRNEPLLRRKRPVLFEYTLIAGVNDSLDDARRLPGLLEGIPSRVNLIPMNPHQDSPHQAPSESVCDAFAAELHHAGVRVMQRRNRGQDIDAACGQLAARGGRGSSQGFGT